MTLEANVIRDGAVSRTSEGYDVAVHIAWYRSLPLSCIEGINITLGDKSFTSEDVRLKWEGELLPLDALADRTEDWWFVQDALTFHVPDASPVGAGEKTKLAISLATRIPYIIIGPNFPLVQRTDVEKEVTVQ